MHKEVIILDSNIWISYAITKRLPYLVTLIFEHHLTVLTCQELVEEIQGVLSRSKFKKYLKNSDIKELITIHLKLCRFVTTETPISKITDTKDNFLLSLYDSGKATLLVTGDKQLHVEATELKYIVMTLNEFQLATTLT